MSNLRFLTLLYGSLTARTSSCIVSDGDEDLNHLNGNMIDHIKLLIVMGNLLFGVAVAMYAHHLYRRHLFAPLKPVFYHLVCINLLVLFLFATKYYDVNVGAEVFSISDTVGSILGMFFLYLFLIGFSYASLGTCLAFLGKGISVANRRKIAVISALLLGGVFLKPLCSEGGLSAKIYYHTYENIGGVFILIELATMILLPIRARKMKDRNLAKLIIAYSILYISRYPAALLLGVIPQPLRIGLFLLMLNGAPFIWCRYYVVPFIARMKPQIAEQTDLSGVAAQFKLSPRETEILGLILGGKNNRDIEELLFISYHTVKNHVYNLYRKLGVKTRFELLHKMSKVSKSAGQTD
jgi:DNA-binding CsgD family transcriptional regulator